MYNDGIRKYQETSISSIGPERMIVMLYEGVVSRLHAAREAVAAGDIPSRCTNLQKAQDIINELSLCLDHNVGGVIAANLASVYDYMNRELLEAQITGSTSHIDNALQVIDPLLEAWRAIKPSTTGQATGTNKSSHTNDGPENAKYSAKEEKSTESICVAV